MDNQTPQDFEAWEGHGHDDERYGNMSINTEEYVRSFSLKVLRDHPEFNKKILSEFASFFHHWERELERIEQVSAQGAAHSLVRYLKL